MIRPQFTTAFGHMMIRVMMVMLIVTLIGHLSSSPICVHSFSRFSIGYTHFIKKHRLLIKTLIVSSSKESSSDITSQYSAKRSQSSSPNSKSQRAKLRSDKDTPIIPKKTKQVHKPLIQNNKDTATYNTNHASRSSSSSLSTSLPTTSNTPAIKSSTSPSVGEGLLLDPTIIFTNNHLLIVNKPAGYHSQPNEALVSLNTTTATTIHTSSSSKCLLTKLKQGQYGGGSQHDFLLPIHRLDQPCTGILLLAKTSKAGSRMGKAFRDKIIEKDYLCIVTGNLETMIQQSLIIQDEYDDNDDDIEWTTTSTNDSRMQFYTDDDDDDDENNETTITQRIRSIKTRRKSTTTSNRNKNTFYRLSGIMEPKSKPKNQKEGIIPSVCFKALPKRQSSHTFHSSSSSSSSDLLTSSGGTRICHLDWTYLSTISSGAMSKNRFNNNKVNDDVSFLKSKDSTSSLMHLLLIKTSTGAKHQIRAMMAQLAKSPICGDLRYGAKEALPDQSVALHARSLYIPPTQVSLGETDLTHPFIASIPSVWKEYFSLTEKDMKQILK